MLDLIVRYIDIPAFCGISYPAYLKREEDKMFREFFSEHPDYSFVEGEKCSGDGRVYYRYVFEKMIE